MLRVLQESIEDGSHFVDLLDWNFAAAPYFLECRYGGQSLTEWARSGLAVLSMPQRISLFLQIADAVAAAHSVGVLHKDLKPGNILVDGQADAMHVRLTDFGSGHMLEPDNLAQLGITRMGMTVLDREGTDSASGTPMYVAPEHFDGQAPTVQSDVFSLGIILYQLLSGRIGQPITPGWESTIEDPFLREDIRLATHSSPAQRFAGVSVLTERLRHLDARRAEAIRVKSAVEASARNQQLADRARARRPFIQALIAILLVSALGALWLQQRALRARDQARVELERSTALTRFLNEDLIGRSNPLVWAKGQDATLREALLSARERVPERFAGQPATAATIHGSLASLLSAIDLFDEAEAEARQALDLATNQNGTSATTEFEARIALVQVLSRRGSFDAAEEQLRELENLGARSTLPSSKARIAAARGALLGARNDFGNAVKELRIALEGLDPSSPSDAAQRDALRLEMIPALTYAGQDQQALEMGNALIAEARGRKDNNDLLIALTQIALVRAQGENHEAAEKLLLAAQPVIIARLGENHSRHLSLLAELMGVAFRRADWIRAPQYAQTVHERFRAKFGTDNVRTYVTLANWARVLDEAGRTQEAAEKARQAHAQLTRLAGPDSPQAQDIAFVLALIELELGRAHAAQAIIDRLDARILESGRALGIWPEAIGGLQGLAKLQRGDKAGARPLLDKALSVMTDEEALAQPGRLYLVLKAAQARSR